MIGGFDLSLSKQNGYLYLYKPADVSLVSIGGLVIGAAAAMVHCGC